MLCDDGSLVAFYAQEALLLLVGALESPAVAGTQIQAAEQVRPEIGHSVSVSQVLNFW